jgi:hypothetical protein
MENVFKTLNAINVNDKTEKKNGLTYLSWAWAWGEVKKCYPTATYTVYENSEGWNYFTDGKTCWVKTGVTIEGLEYIEYLPVMDYRNKSIPLEIVTSFDVNKTIQRSLTKALARHGLGLYIYAGEDLPEEEANAPEPKVDNKKPEPKVDNNKQIEDATINTIKKLACKYAGMKENGNEEELLNHYLNKYEVDSISNLTRGQGLKIIQNLNKAIGRSIKNGNR